MIIHSRIKKKIGMMLALLLSLNIFILDESALARRNNGEKNHQIDWAAGAAAVDITPQSKHMENEDLYLGGYGIGRSRGAALGIRQKIWARSLALSHEEEKVALVVLDLPGISCEDIARIRNLASHKANIEPQNIIVTVTHTHSGPDLQGLWGGVPDSYRKWLHSKAATSVAGALENMESAQLYAGTTDYAEGISNRRDEKYLDPSLHYLHFQAKNSNDPIASLAIYGAHTTFLGEENRKVSPDFSGKLVEKLENKFGGTAIFAPGIQGDQTPQKDNLSINEYAENLSGAVEKAYQKSEQIPIQSLNYDFREFSLHVSNPVFILASILGRLPYYNVQFNFSRGTYINTEISRLSISDNTGDQLSLVSVPGEILARPGLELKELDPAEDTMIIGLTNGSLGYILHEEQWESGIPFLTRGYEESVSMGMHSWVVMRKQWKEMFR